MALTDQLVIDATTHGGRARFVNHSCEPNCRIENWVVGRERRIGVFSARAIGADEELTIDYQARVCKWRVMLALIITNCSCSTRATTKNRFDFSNALTLSQETCYNIFCTPAGACCCLLCRSILSMITERAPFSRFVYVVLHRARVSSVGEAPKV